MQRNFIKLCTFLISSILLFCVSQSKTFAIVAEPSFGDYKKGTEVSIELLATPPEGEINAVSIYLASEGMTIENYTAPEGWLIVIGTCDGDVQFTESEVCVSLAKTEVIKEGDSLGIIKAKITADNGSVLMKLDGSAYSDGQGKYDEFGTIASFNEQIVEVTPTTTAQTKTENETNNLLPFIVGSIVIVVVFGILAIFYLMVKKKDKRIANVVAISIGFASLLGFLSIVIVSLNNDQSPKESSASGGVTCYRCTGNLYDDPDKCESKSFTGQCGTGWSESDPCKAGSKSNKDDEHTNKYACTSIKTDGKCGESCGPNWNGEGMNQGKACKDGLTCVFVEERAEKTPTCSTDESIYVGWFQKDSFACINAKNDELVENNTRHCGKTQNGYDTHVITKEEFHDQKDNDCPKTVTTVSPTPTVSTTPTVTPTTTPTITPPPDAVVCGVMDSSGNGVMDFADMAPFLLVFGKYCSDSPSGDGACGPKNTNPNDGEGEEKFLIDVVDLSKFTTLYQDQTDCSTL